RQHGVGGDVAQHDGGVVGGAEVVEVVAAKAAAERAEAAAEVRRDGGAAGPGVLDADHVGVEVVALHQGLEGEVVGGAEVQAAAAPGRHRVVAHGHQRQRAARVLRHDAGRAEVGAVEV